MLWAVCRGSLPISGPEKRRLDVIRALNITLRTAHLAAMGMLLGGHAFDVSPESLKPILWVTIGTGVALAAVESRFQASWLHEARGFLILVKLALICIVPFAWEYRVPILLVVTVIASVGSHMPRRFRHYSVLYRRVVYPNAGSGRRPRQNEGGKVTR